MCLKRFFGDIQFSELKQRHLQIALLSYFFFQFVIVLFQINDIRLWKFNVKTSDILLVLLFSTIVNDYQVEMCLRERVHAFIFGLLGISLYFYLSTIVPVNMIFPYLQTPFFYFSALVAISIPSIIIMSSKNTLEENITMHTHLIGLTALLALTAGLLRTWRWIPDLVLIGVAICIVIQYLSPSTEQYISPQGVDDILFNSVVQIGRSPEGIATAGVLYMGFFSGITSVAILLPELKDIYLNNPVATNIREIILNMSSITHMILLIIFLFHLILLLTRVPHSVDHWNSGNHNKYRREISAPNRPLVVGLLLPILGLVFSYIPQLDVELNGPIITTRWGLFFAIIYFSLVLLSIIYSVAAIPHLKKLRRLPKTSRFVSDRPDLDMDFYTYLFVGVSIVLINAITISPSVVPILLGPIYLYICEVKIGIFSIFWNLATTGIVFVIIMPMYIATTNSAVQFWQVLIIFLFVYSLCLVRTRRESIASTIRAHT